MENQLVRYEDLTTEEKALYPRAVGAVRRCKTVKATTLQLRLKISFIKAARLLDVMESCGLVSEPGPGNVREVFHEKGI